MSLKFLNHFEEIARRYARMLRNFNILANGYGQWGSVRNWDSRDGLGNEVPWYTYPAIEYLSHLDLRDMSVFEFGSGNSTIWWLGKALSVHCVEDNSEWHGLVQNRLGGNKGNLVCELKTNKADYLNALNSSYDITVIDGKFRTECIEKYFEFSDDGVMLILDNSDRYPASIEKIRKTMKWVELDFHGLGPINGYTWTTTIFINPHKLNRINYQKELCSTAGLKQNMERDI